MKIIRRGKITFLTLVLCTGVSKIEESQVDGEGLKQKMIWQSPSRLRCDNAYKNEAQDDKKQKQVEKKFPMILL